MVIGAGVGSCRTTTHHRLVNQYCPVQRPPCPFRGGKEEKGGEALATGRYGRRPTGFIGVRFPVVIGSPVRVIRPPSWLAPPVLLPTPGAREGTDLRGLSLPDY